MGWKYQSLQQHGHVQGRQANIQLIRIIRCPASLLGFLEVPIRMDDFEQQGLIDNLGVSHYV